MTICAAQGGPNFGNFGGSNAGDSPTEQPSSNGESSAASTTTDTPVTTAPTETSTPTTAAPTDTTTSILTFSPTLASETPSVASSTSTDTTTAPSETPTPTVAETATLTPTPTVTTATPTPTSTSTETSSVSSVNVDDSAASTSSGVTSSVESASKHSITEWGAVLGAMAFVAMVLVGAVVVYVKTRKDPEEEEKPDVAAIQPPPPQRPPAPPSNNYHNQPPPPVYNQPPSGYNLPPTNQQALYRSMSPKRVDQFPPQPTFNPSASLTRQTQRPSKILNRRSVNDVMGESIDYNDPALDVLTPLSDIVTAHGYQSSFSDLIGGPNDMNRSPSNILSHSYSGISGDQDGDGAHSSRGDTFASAYDAVDAIKNQYPSQVLSTVENDIYGSSDSEDESSSSDESDDDDSIMTDSFDGDYNGKVTAVPNGGQTGHWKEVDIDKITSQYTDEEEIDVFEYHDSFMSQQKISLYSSNASDFRPTGFEYSEVGMTDRSKSTVYTDGDTSKQSMFSVAGGSGDFSFRESSYFSNRSTGAEFHDDDVVDFELTKRIR